MSDKSSSAQKAWKTRRKTAKKRSNRAIKAWKTRLSNWEKLRKSVLIVECIPEDEVDCSEAKMLKELFRIINVQMKDNKENVKLSTVKADNAQELLSTLKKADQSCIHISCHGAYFKNYKKTGFKLSHGRLFSDELCSTKNREHPIWNERLSDKKASVPQLVFLSACETAHNTDLVERFMQAGVRYIIAPRNETPFCDASLFSSIFYPLVYVEQMNPYIAFKKVKEAFPKMAGNWKFFDLYKHDFKVFDPNGTGKL